MVVRLVEFITQPGAAGAFCHCFETEILPALRRRAGFCNATCLVLHPEPRIVVVLMFWQSRPKAEEYFQQVFPKLVPTLLPHVDGISMRDFDVAIPLSAAAAA